MEVKLQFVLGCNGHKINNFVNCSSVKNIILILDSTLYSYNDIINFLDARNAFDHIISNKNAVVNMMYNLNNKFNACNELWTEEQFKIFSDFVYEHKKCGIYLKLDFLER